MITQSLSLSLAAAAGTGTPTAGGGGSGGGSGVVFYLGEIALYGLAIYKTDNYT